MTVQWYPGHMAKAKRLLEENLKLVNIVIEICDARLPYSSRNPEIDKIIGNKPRIIVLNKQDLADKKVSEFWANYYQEKGISVVFTDSKSGDGVKKVIEAINGTLAAKIARNEERGRKTTTLYAMVVGIPNVGKSSFINRVAGKAVAVTGDKPGVTKDKQWLKMSEDIYLLDTPGLLWPKIENQLAAMRLASSGAIKDEVTDQGELCAFLLSFIDKNYPGALDARFNIKSDELLSGDEEDLYVTESVLGSENLHRGLALLEACGKSRGCLLKGGEVDLNRACKVVLDEYRAGKIGNISLDLPYVLEEEKVILAANAEFAKRKERNNAERRAKYRRRKG